MQMTKHLLYFFMVIVLMQNACKPEKPREPSLTVGQSYEGGKIFFIDITGVHGLIAAPSDQSRSSKWGCNGKPSPNTSSYNGYGKNNTDVIVGICPTKNTPAQICYDLEIGGFKDWFLPSKNELNLLYLQKDMVGGFANAFYWSSTEYDGYSIWCQHFFNGNQDNNGKYASYAVRAIRSF